MSSLLISKRDFIKGLFIAPAIVAVTNIMPIKAIEKFTLSDFNPNNEKWVMIKSKFETAPMWIKNSQFEIYVEKHNYDVVRTQFLEPALNPKNVWAEDTIRLRKVFNTHVITSPLPGHMIMFSDRNTGFIV